MHMLPKSVLHIIVVFIWWMYFYRARIFFHFRETERLCRAFIFLYRCGCRYAFHILGRMKVLTMVNVEYVVQILLWRLVCGKHIYLSPECMRRQNRLHKFVLIHKYEAIWK